MTDLQYGNIIDYRDIVIGSSNNNLLWRHEFNKIKIKFQTEILIVCLFCKYVEYLRCIINFKLPQINTLEEELKFPHEPNKIKTKYQFSKQKELWNNFYIKDKRWNVWNNKRLIIPVN